MAGHEPVLRQNCGQARERVEARVGGEEEQQGRERLEQEEGHRVVAVHPRRDLRDDGLALGQVDMGDPEIDCQERNADEEHAQQPGHYGQGRRCVAGLGRLERADARSDGLRAGQGDRSRGEGAHQQQRSERLGSLLCLADQVG